MTMRARTDRGFSMLELLIVLAIISIIAAFAVPRLLRARATANEASAIAGLRAVASAQDVYIQSCGKGGFATSLVILGTPPPGSPIAFLSPDMTMSTTPIKSGFTFTMTAGAGATPTATDCNGQPTQSTFYGTAVPQAFGVGGSRSFAINANHAIWESYTSTAPTEPFGPPAVPIQ